MARTVELAEIHALPDAEDGLAVLDEHGLARADIAALEVRGRIALGMPELAPVGKRLAQTEQQIVLHIRVGVFVDGDTGGRVRTVHHGKTALHTALADDFTQSGGDIVHALVIGRDGKFPGFHAHSPRLSCR